MATTSSDLVASAATPAFDPTKPRKAGSIKCVIWDLDHTVWDGILLEDGDVRLRPDVRETIETLDARGILHSAASRNDSATALAKLREFGLLEYFLYPQIHWNPKSGSVAQIAKDLNLALDAFAFIDDQAHERDEVTFSLPQVLCLDAEEVGRLVEMPELTPRFITEDSSQRRRMYQADIRRNQAEAEYVGAQEEFLATLGLKFSIAPAREEDLKRAEELTVRTHQLNTTGYTYSYDELDAFRRSPDHLLLVASLVDRYGTYGKIGLALLELGSPEAPDVWTIKLLLMSCRVMSKGVGTLLILHLLDRARRAGARLCAEFVSNDRNRMMLVTYKFAGFKQIERRGDIAVLEGDLSRVQPFPPYVEVEIEE